MGKVYGSLARAGKIRGQTPKLAKQDKKKQPQGRAYKRMQYNPRFVTATERRDKKRAYVWLRQISRLQGKKPPPNPYPSSIKEIQAEEKKFVQERFNDRRMLEVLQRMREEKELQDRLRGGNLGF